MIEKSVDYNCSFRGNLYIEIILRRQLYQSMQMFFKHKDQIIIGNISQRNPN